MYNIFKAELFKLSKSISTKVIFIYSVIMLIIAHFSNNYIQNFLASKDLSQEEILTLDLAPLLDASFINIYNLTTFDFFSLLIIVFIFISFIFLREFKDGTIKNYIPFGIKKSHFLLGKYFALLFILFILFLTLSTTSIILFKLIYYPAPILLTDLLMSLKYTIALFSIFSFLVSIYIFIGFIVKKTYLLIIIGLFAFFADLFIYTKIQGNLFSLLLKISVFKTIEQISSPICTNTKYFSKIVLNIIFSFIFMLFTYIIFLKRDIEYGED